MKVQPMRFVADRPGYAPCDPTEATHIRLLMPGPMPNRILSVRMGNKISIPEWNWNGDVEKPTIRPSILTRDGTHVCHSFITDGVVHFLNDCTHELAGRTVDLLDID